MEFTDIAYEKHGEITVIRFDRPSERNCISPVASRELVEAWTLFRDDPEAKAAIITGAGDVAFCSGGDLKTNGLFPKTQSEMAAHSRGERPGICGPTRWTDIYKPIIAAINGAALGGGLEWACFADIRIAEEHAVFAASARRWNIPMGDGGTQRLPRIIGLGRAMEMIITGRVINALEAEKIGLVNEIVPEGHSLPRAMELARQICALPQPAIQADKESAIRGYGRPLPRGLRIEAENFNRIIGTPEMDEGFRRFRERDHPDLAND